MLEAVSPDFTGSQSGVRSYEIAELFNFNLQAFFLGNLLYVIHNNSMRTGVYAYDNGFIHIYLAVILRTAAACSYDSKHCQYAHKSVF